MKFKIVITGIIAALLTSCSVFDDGYHKVIKNTKQFLQIPDDSDSNYMLGADLDFSGVAFSPKRFRGRLDGNGYVISNLTITSSEDYVGLFSKCAGTVSNLTIKNVKIDAPQADYVGVISGSGGTFTNCKVIFGTTSFVTGDRYVGGMSGSDAKFTGCYIESTSQNPVVRGNGDVGGLVGSTRSVIESCAVKAIVVGAEDVGGIVGSGIPSIRSSSFQGKVEGKSNIGGIIGTYESWHEGSLMHSCKVDADVIARESSAGGLIGNNMNNEHEVISCYTQGSVNAKTRCGGLVGDRYSLRCDLCYSVMESSSDSFDGLGVSYHTDCATVHSPCSSIYGTNVKYNCTDITTFLKECYSEYADYWNYEDTWLYNGTVSCPKLAWESSFDQSQLEDTNPWNGNKASAFSSGTGTLWDPYIITTGGQLLLAKDYSGKYFALGGNIDLNNKNWLPFEFKGTLDGKGYMITNLCINRIDDYQGLFSKCGGTVSNLTVKNVKIDAPQADYVGVISGSGGTFTNCKVIFGVSSSVTGDRYVGGIAGYGASMVRCSVESTSSGYVVRGNTCVGGLVGQIPYASYNVVYEIGSCSVKAMVAGSEYVGGLVGDNRADMDITNSCFVGKASGKNYVGGIVGYNYTPASNNTISSCFVDADITASGECAGGILGSDYSYSVKIVSCYTKGSVNATKYCGGLLGCNSAYTELCYSVMESSSGCYYGLGEDVSAKDCATVHSKASAYTVKNTSVGCTDITTHLRDCYSEHATNWNFNNTWRYNGTVSCPKLAWEK
jgi:hypothetical protein